MLARLRRFANRAYFETAPHISTPPCRELLDGLRVELRDLWCFVGHRRGLLSKPFASNLPIAFALRRFLEKQPFLPEIKRLTVRESSRFSSCHKDLWAKSPRKVVR